MLARTPATPKRYLAVLLLVACVVACAITVSDASAASGLRERNATAMLKKQLAHRYGSAWTDASRHWALCPKEEFFRHGFDGKSRPVAICMAEFRSTGKRWRFVSATLQEKASGTAIDKPFTRTWKRRWHKQSSRCRRQADVRGAIYSNDGTCPALQVSDLAYALARHQSTKFAYWHGTNTAGFEKVARFRCHRHGRSIRCVNKMGDGFRWKR